MDDFQKIIEQIIATYCVMVRNLNRQAYSPIIQKIIAYIDTDLRTDLSLKTFAKYLNVNASYLSVQFRKETGKTLTEYIRDVRMDAAAYLLRNTRLQIQTVAQHCGMSDVNYFSKLFKKTHGITPKQFRDYCSEK